MRTYEELTGAEGRRMFYRAERFRPEDLFREAVPAVFFDDERAALKDISMTGLAAQSVNLDGWNGRLGDEIPFELRVGQDGLYRGAGACAVSSRAATAPPVALEFTSGYLDIPRS